MTISNTDRRDLVISKLEKAGRRAFRADWTNRSAGLARGEIMIDLRDVSFRWTIIFSPDGARSPEDGHDMMYFYGPNGVLCHEEPAAESSVRVSAGMIVLPGADPTPAFLR